MRAEVVIVAVAVVVPCDSAVGAAAGAEVVGADAALPTNCRFSARIVSSRDASVNVSSAFCRVSFERPLASHVPPLGTFRAAACAVAFSRWNAGADVDTVGAAASGESGCSASKLLLKVIIPVARLLKKRPRSRMLKQQQQSVSACATQSFFFAFFFPVAPAAAMAAAAAAAADAEAKGGRGPAAPPAETFSAAVASAAPVE